MSKRIALLSAAAFSALGAYFNHRWRWLKMPRKRPRMVGGAAMFPSKNIIQNAVNSKDHTTLVARR